MVGSICRFLWCKYSPGGRGRPANEMSLKLEREDAPEPKLSLGHPWKVV